MKLTTPVREAQKCDMKEISHNSICSRRHTRDLCLDNRWMLDHLSGPHHSKCQEDQTTQRNFETLRFPLRSSSSPKLLKHHAATHGVAFFLLLPCALS